MPAGGCGGAAGGAWPVAWRAEVGGAGRLVYVGTSAGDLVAVQAAGCGASTCGPVYRRALGAVVSDAITVSGGLGEDEARSIAAAMAGG